jgi:hypothetical protein
MKNKIMLVGMAVGSLLTPAVYASPAVIDDSALDAIAGKNNSFAMGSTAGVTTDIASLGNDNAADIQFIWYQWGDDHSSDNSNDKGGNNLQGASSQVQQNVTAGVNATIWGWVSQSYLDNSGNIGADQRNWSYCGGAFGGF